MEVRNYSKKQLRALMRERMAEHVPTAGETAEIWSRLEALEEFRSARTVLMYMDIDGEVPTRSFIARWAGSKRIAIPVVKGEDIELRLYNPDALTEGYMGITEPTDDAPFVSPSEIDLAVIPGIAFTREGARLGHGKGFYDRMLPMLGCPRLGVCFDYRIVSSIPTDPWDEFVDGLV